jgi:secreted trypsin-like serine protease
MLPLFAIILIVVVQRTSADIYQCDHRMNSCGCSTRLAITAKIFGGESAEPHSWGWAVSLRQSNDHFCGGSILNEWYIITAAHCLVKKMHMLSSITVCAGTDRLKGICRQNRTVHHVINHFAFNNQTLENDISLLRLEMPLDFTDPLIAQICLPDARFHNEYPQNGSDVIAVGWGKTEISQSSDQLQQVRLKVGDKLASTCNSSRYNDHLQICADAFEKGMLPLFSYLLYIPSPLFS